MFRCCLMKRIRTRIRTRIRIRIRIRIRTRTNNRVEPLINLEHLESLEDIY